MVGAWLQRQTKWSAAGRGNYQGSLHAAPSGFAPPELRLFVAPFHLELRLFVAWRTDTGGARPCAATVYSLTINHGTHVAISSPGQSFVFIQKEEIHATHESAAVL
jgi:hypothetical protein